MAVNNCLKWCQNEKIDLDDLKKNNIKLEDLCSFCKEQRDHLILIKKKQQTQVAIPQQRKGFMRFIELAFQKYLIHKEMIMYWIDKEKQNVHRRSMEKIRQKHELKMESKKLSMEKSDLKHKQEMERREQKEKERDQAQKRKMELEMMKLQRKGRKRLKSKCSHLEEVDDTKDMDSHRIKSMNDTFDGVLK